MPFQTKNQVTEATWRKGVQEKRVVGGRIYNTKAAADQAKGNQVRNPPKTAKAAKNAATKSAPAPPNPYKGWVATDHVYCEKREMDISIHHNIGPTVPVGHKLASVLVVIRPGDCDKLNWRYAFSDTAEATHSITELVDAGAKGDHDISYFEKAFNLEVPQFFKTVVDGPEPRNIYLHWASRRHLEDDLEVPKYTIKIRTLGPAASGSGSQEILHL
jgi:hypothetical protein